MNNPLRKNNTVSAVTDPFDDRYQTACFWGSVDPSTLWQRFAILTPCNPRGVTLEDAANLRLIEDFVHEIRSQELPSIWMMVGSPDGLHQETSFALPLDEARARRMSQRFNQLSFYAIDEGGFFLCRTSSSARVSLGPWTGRLFIDHRLEQGKILSRVSIS